MGLPELQEEYRRVVEEYEKADKALDRLYEQQNEIDEKVRLGRHAVIHARHALEDVEKAMARARDEELMISPLIPERNI
jgi:hypothetical protein